MRAQTQSKRIEVPGAERIPPQDLDAEMSLLGSMMLNREAIGMVLPIIHPKDAQRFYLPEHQELFKILVDLYDTNKPIDLVVVKDELQLRNLQAQISDEYMVDLVQSVATWLNAEHYANIVRDKSLLRDLISCASTILGDAYAQDDQAHFILDRAEQKVFELTEQRVSNQAKLLGLTLNEVYQQISCQDGAFVSGLPTGFLELDEITNGLQPGELIILAGRPSMGKTALGLNIAERLAVNEKTPTAFFSMEMNRQQVAQRILCSRGRVDAHKMRAGKLNEGEIAQLAYVCQMLEEAPLFIDDTPGMTMLELRAKARRLHLKEKIQCIFVDYLQLMYIPKLENRQQEIATISRGLKGLARELHIPVVAMAQLNRATEQREDNRPRLSNLRESGAIEQDADVVALLHRPEYYSDNVDHQGKAELIIAKQRNGPTRSLWLQFNKQLAKFENLSMASEPFMPPAQAQPETSFP